METSDQEAKLLEARTLFALDKYADSVGVPLSQLLNEFPGEHEKPGTKNADQLRACAYIAWSYYRDSKLGIRFELRDLVDWARFIGYLSGALQIIDLSSRFDPVANGKKGLVVRHAPMKQLKEWALAKFRSRDWSSANAAALALEKEIIEYGRTINASLSPTNARRTIAEWFRESA